MTSPETTSSRKRKLLYLLISLAAFAVTVGIFYAEEDARGWLAMKKCKAALAAQGEDLNWSKRIPAPVPESENVFGVPEMQKWFVGRGTNELSAKLSYPGGNGTNRLLVSHCAIGLPGASPEPGTAVFQFGDSNARPAICRLIDDALGPIVVDPMGTFFYTKQSVQDFRPVHIFLQCQRTPTLKELEEFMPAPLIKTFGRDSSIDGKFEQTGDGSYDITVPAPTTMADYLKWCDQFEPVFGVIRQALHRPYARMEGDYSSPSEIPFPNFVAVRVVAQRLAAKAECHLSLGQPEEALADLTLVHDLCRRVLQENQPMTLVSAMINVAVRGLCANVIADGMESHAWLEPQLAALEGQLKEINLLAPVQLALKSERFSLAYRLSTDTPEEIGKLMHVTTLVVGVKKK